MWAEGLFIWIGFGVSLVMRAWRVFHEFANRNERPKEIKPHWRDMDYNYLVALNELNVMCPTDTEEEKGLARYLEFNDREDHERRQRNKEQQPVRVGGTVTGSFATLYAPGLSNALGGVSGLLGGAGLGLANGFQQQQNQLAAQLGAAQQQQGAFQLLAQQRSMMQMGTADNNINPLSALAQALQESKKLDS